MRAQRGPFPRRPPGLPFAQRGPGASYRPDPSPPSLHGFHQPGVTTPLLDHLAFAALDVAACGRGELRELLRAITLAGEREMRAAAGRITLTVGLGPGLFGERFGLRARRPFALAELPAFPGDALDPARSGGDLCVQACGTDAAAAASALAAVLAVARPTARVRWSQRGRMHRGPHDRPQTPPRNLMGFKDATSNPRRGKDLDRHVWIAGRERSWMVGGTYLVVRRVRLLHDAWDALSPAEQEGVIGRDRRTGSPLDQPDAGRYEPVAEGGATPADAHARVMAPRRNGGITLLRRGYSYDDAPGCGGERDAGLFLLIYQRDPRRQFVPLQRRMAERDALRHYTRAVGSAVFAIPPGTRSGPALAHDLLEDAAAARVTRAARA